MTSNTADRIGQSIQELRLFSGHLLSSRQTFAYLLTIAALFFLNFGAGYSQNVDFQSPWADSKRGCPAPSAAFTSTNNLSIVSFSDQSTSSNTLQSWFWDFGDGGTTVLQNPQYTYGNIGSYFVCLIVTDSCGADTTCSTVTIACPPPTAAFTSTTNLFTASFIDQSNTGSGIIAWHWEFGDGNISSLQNPQHIYATTGTYAVCLMITDSCATRSWCAPVTISCPAPTVAFSYANNGMIYDFQDLTAGTGMVNRLWDFGDGNTSIYQNPQHMYANPGFFNVCLTVTDSCGSDSSCQSLDVLVGLEAMGADFVTLFPNPSNAVINLKLPTGINAELAISLFDMLGKELQSFEVPDSHGDTLAISLDDQAEGIYLLRIGMNEQVIFRRVEILRE